MEQFIEQVISAPHKEILVAVIVIWVITKKQYWKILSFIQEFKFREISSDQIKLFIENDSFSDDFSNSLVEHFERTTFYKAYGIKANKEKRTTLLAFYSKHEKKISWSDLKRAYENIEFDGSTMIIRFYVSSTLIRVMIGLTYCAIYSLLLFSCANLFLSGGDDQSSELMSIAFIYYVVFSFFDFFGWKSLSTIKVQMCIDGENNE